MNQTHFQPQLQIAFTTFSRRTCEQIELLVKIEPDQAGAREVREEGNSASSVHWCRTGRDVRGPNVVCVYL